jgi:hypothetical protein
MKTEFTFRLFSEWLTVFLKPLSSIVTWGEKVPKFCSRLPQGVVLLMQMSLSFYLSYLTTLQPLRSFILDSYYHPCNNMQRYTVNLYVASNCSLKFRTWQEASSVIPQKQNKE